MDIASIIGIIGGIATIIFGGYSGGSIGGLFHIPSLFITVGGSYMCLFIAFPLQYAIGIFKVCGKVFKKVDYREKELVQKLVALSEKSRRNGLLALEEEIDDFEDRFMRTGLQNAIDGIDGEAIRALMENELSQIEARHAVWISLLNQWATLAPGFGMLGTVMGLIGMLMNLEDKSALGPNMATALITTFYGSIMANWLFIPMAEKLKYQSDCEVRSKEMIIEGVLGILAGDHPRILTQKLMTYLEPKDALAIEAEFLGD